MNPKVQGTEKRKAEADPRAESGPRAEAGRRSAASPGELDWGLRCDCGEHRRPAWEGGRLSRALWEEQEGRYAQGQQGE